MLNDSIKQNTEIKNIYVGIDVHAKSYAVAVVEDGSVIKRWTCPANPEELAESLQKKYAGSQIHTAYEAGFSGFVLHRVLVGAGIDSIVVNAASIAVINNNRVKTDKRDAQKIAMQLAAKMLVGIRVPSLHQELSRQPVRLRFQLVKARGRVMNQIRKRLWLFGYKIIKPGALQIKSVEQLLSKIEENELTQTIRIELREWESLNEQIKEVDSIYKKQALLCPLEQLYRSVPGVGAVTARVLATELGDMSDFKSEKAMFCFTGLTPSEKSSGESIRKGHISRQGSARLRHLLVEAAWVAKRYDDSLKNFYFRLSFKLGPKKAIVATARKLIGRIRAVIKNKENYRCSLEK